MNWNWSRHHPFLFCLWNKCRTQFLTQNTLRPSKLQLTWANCSFLQILDSFQWSYLRTWEHHSWSFENFVFYNLCWYQCYLILAFPYLISVYHYFPTQFLKRGSLCSAYTIQHKGFTTAFPLQSHFIMGFPRMHN